jgi:hypothetical protein
MVIARRAPQICPPLIPFCSRFDSVLFTPKMPAIAGRFNFPRPPRFNNGIEKCRPTVLKKVNILGKAESFIE